MSPARRSAGAPVVCGIVLPVNDFRSAAKVVPVVASVAASPDARTNRLVAPKVKLPVLPVHCCRAGIVDGLALAAGVAAAVGVVSTMASMVPQSSRQAA